MGCTESKAAKTAGSDDEGTGKRKSAANRDKKKAAQAAPAGGGIECFTPDDETMANYLRYLDAVRQDAALKGIMAPVPPTMGFPPTPATATPRSAGRGKYAASPSEEARSAGKASPSSPATAGPAGTGASCERTVSAYCCRPLLTASDSSPMLVGKGLYSAVYLADLTLLAGPPDHVATRLAALCSAQGSAVGGADDALFQKRYLIAMKELRLFARQRNFTMLMKIENHVRNWARISAYCPGLVQCIHMEQVFDESDASGKTSSLSVASPHTSAHYVESVTNIRTFGTVSANSTGDLSEGGGGIGKGKLFTRVAARKAAAATGAAATHSSQVAILEAKGHTAAALAAVTEPAAPTPSTGGASRVTVPSRLRIYVDFQRYGTLRNAQIRQMQQRFQKNYLHELTARALMHDVLKTLAHLHSEDTLQYDLNASAIFIHHPLRAVYHTFFPAYISDLAVGDWRSLPPDQWKAALVLNDPATDEKGNYNGNRGEAGAAGNDQSARHATAHRDDAGRHGSPRQAGVRGERPPNLSPARVAVHAPSSQQNTDPVSPLILAQQEASMAVNLNDLQLDVTLVHGPVSSSLASPSSPGFGSLYKGEHNNVSFAAAGLEALANGDGSGGKTALLEWSNEKLKQCMEANGYTDCTGPPLPSPHDGAACQEDANQFESMAMYETGVTLLEPQSVAAINAAPNQPVSQRTVALEGAGGGGANTANVSPLAKSPTVAASPDAAKEKSAAVADKAATPGAANYGVGGVVLWAPDRFPPSSVSSAVVPETQHVRPPQTLTATMDTSAFADLSDVLDRTDSVTIGNESFFVSEQLKQLKQQLGADATQRRHRPPITKMNHVAAVRRVLAAPLTNGSTADVPAHKFVSVGHAAPEALLRRQFTKASDIYAFAMTFIELVTPDGAIMPDCLPPTKPKTRAEKAEYDETYHNNLCKWYSTRIALLTKHHDAVAEEQRLPPCVEQPVPPPVVTPVPEHLSDECKRMLRWCLQKNPDKRPTAAQLLQSKYFLFGDWISQGEPSCPSARLPEPPWEPLPASYEALAESAGLPLLSRLAPSDARRGQSKKA